MKLFLVTLSEVLQATCRSSTRTVKSVATPGYRLLIVFRIGWRPHTRTDSLHDLQIHRLQGLAETQRDKEVHTQRERFTALI